MTSVNVDPITSLQPSQEQHMLLAFLPVLKGVAKGLVSSANEALSSAVTPDLRAATGVHFFMLHGVSDGAISTIPVPTFKSPKGKDTLVVLSIYDAPFTPYISAFTNIPAIAAGLDMVLQAMDETGIIPPTESSSAAFILSHGGVFKNSTSFIQLLMRYNFADPTIPAATGAGDIANPQPNPKYFLGATFPGLTVGSILQNYPDAGALWPLPSPKITYAPSLAIAPPIAEPVPAVHVPTPVPTPVLAT